MGGPCEHGLPARLFSIDRWRDHPSAHAPDAMGHDWRGGGVADRSPESRLASPLGKQHRAAGSHISGVGRTEPVVVAVQNRKRAVVPYLIAVRSVVSHREAAAD